LRKVSDSCIPISFFFIEKKRIIAAGRLAEQPIKNLGDSFLDGYGNFSAIAMVANIAHDERIFQEHDYGKIDFSELIRDTPLLNINA
jgi:hypothetical protein